MKRWLYKSLAFAAAVLVGIPAVAGCGKEESSSKDGSSAPSSSGGSVASSQTEALNPGDVKMNSYFDDHMMFQQEKPISVWGKDSTAEVTVTLTRDKDGQVVDQQTVKTEEGIFRVALKAQTASFDTYTLTVEGSGKKQFVDVLIGELWVAAGQSNMELQTKYITGGRKLMSEASNDHIRFFMEPTVGSTSSPVPYSPQFDVESSGWDVGTDQQAVGELSGIGYLFAMQLYDELNQEGRQVPIGILDTALGGTFIDAWLSREAIEGNKAVMDGMGSRYLTKEEFNKSEGQNYTQMSSCYNRRIAPLASTNVRGILWYQGCGNVGDYGSAQYYRAALNVLMKEWSGVFGSPDAQLPFIFAQIAPNDYNAPENLAHFNEGLADVYLDNPDISAVVPLYDVDLTWSSDIMKNGHPVHPLTKTPVAERMARAALHLAYGVQGEYMAPVLQSATVSGSKILLTFSHVGDGLQIRGGEKTLLGFAIAGADGIFIQADAKITGKNTVEVSSPYIASPKVASYAFCEMNMQSNLCNSLGYPAVACRTERGSYRYFYQKTWAECKEDQDWVLDDTEAAPNARFEPAWKTGSGVTAKADKLTVIKDRYAVGFTYDAGAILEFGPDFSHKTSFPQFENYARLIVDVYNPDGRTKTFQGIGLEVMGDDFLIAPGSQKTVAANGWTTLTIDLTSIREADGSAADGADTILANTDEFRFTFQDSGAGTLFLSNIRFAP